MTRIDMSALRRDPDQQLRPATRLRIDLQRPTDRVEALAHPGQPQALALRAREDGGHVEAHAVVADEAAKAPRLPGEANPHVPGSRVPGDVGERLLDDAVQGGLDVRGLAVLQGALDLDR